MRARRLVLVTVLYLLGSSVLLGVGRELGSILVLPPLFDALLVLFLLLGLGLVLAAAWRYGDVEE